MDYSNLFARAWQLVWRYKYLWVLGLLLGIGNVSGNLARVLFNPSRFFHLDQWFTPQGMVSPPPDISFLQVEGFVIKASVVFFVASIGFWLIATLAEGALIVAVLGLDRERPLALSHALAAGYRLLGRFIAIDTIVFFPWFLIALLILVLAFVGLVGTAVIATKGAELGPMLGGMGAIAICLLPLLCLLLPAGMLTIVFRALAFRDNAFHEPGIRASIRHTGQVIWRNLGAVLMLAILTWGIQYLLNLVTSLIMIPVVSLTAVPDLFPFAAGIPQTSQAGSLLTALGLFIGLLAAIPQAIVHAFTATVWTLAYAEMLKDEG